LTLWTCYEYGLGPGNEDSKNQQRAEQSNANRERATTRVGLERPTRGTRAIVEPPVRAKVALAVDRVPEIVRAIGIFGFVGLLCAVSVSCEVLVRETRQ
jgi:hypothetical protein